jgi:acyl carrier protein
MDKLNKIISRTFGLREDQIEDDLVPGEVEKWDSLTQIVLISAIESEYKIVFDIEDILGVMTIGDIRSILNKKLAKEKNG